MLGTPQARSHHDPSLGRIQAMVGYDMLLVFSRRTERIRTELQTQDKTSKELAAAGYLNERGKPYVAKSVASMLTQ